MMDKKVGVEGVGTEGSYKLQPADKNMSVRHLKDTLEYNLKHAEDHLKRAKEACERLTKAGEDAAIPRSLVDLGEYFEKKGGYEESVDGKRSKADRKLNNIIKRSY